MNFNISSRLSEEQPPQIHADLGVEEVEAPKLQLLIRGSDGRLSYIEDSKLSEDQKKVLADYSAKYLVGQEDFSIDLTECTVTINRGMERLDKDHDKIKPLRDLAIQVMGSRLLSRVYLSTHRTEYPAIIQPYSYSSPRIKELKFEEKDLIARLDEIDVTNDDLVKQKQKIDVLKRYEFAKHLLQRAKKPLQEIQNDYSKDKKTEAQGQVQRLQTVIDRIENLDSFAIFFEAAYPKVDRMNNQSNYTIRAEKALKLIQQRAEPKTSVLGLSIPFTKNIDEQEEHRYAHELACNFLNGSREGYEALAREMEFEPTPEPMESFFMKLMSDRGNDLLQSPEFDRIFSGLTDQDKSLIRQELSQGIEFFRDIELERPYYGMGANGPLNPSSLSTWSEVFQANNNQGLANAVSLTINARLRDQNG